jgi:uncharacterized protein (DUF488 family)
MNPSATFELLTIGHSNLAADRFVELLKNGEVTTLADVRSVPFSRWCPWFSRRPLAERLAREEIGYLELGDALGGRPRDPRLYRDGAPDYEAMARAPEFLAGIARLREAMDRGHVCIMCAERDPLDCHRCLLIARVLAERGIAIGHILGDGAIEPHAATEQRLLAALRGGADLFGDDAARLAEAYRRRNRGTAARPKS